MIELVDTLEPTPEQLDRLALALVRELLQGGKNDRLVLVEQSRQSLVSWSERRERERAALAAALLELSAATDGAAGG